MSYIKYLKGVLPDSTLVLLSGVESGGLNSFQFHNALERVLQRAGYETRREVFVPNRGDGMRGKVDLVATREKETLAIELDRHTARQKSIFKVANYRGATCSMVICREPERE